MNLRCDQFRDGGPSPSVYYSGQLVTAYRDVCAAYRGCAGVRTKLHRSALEPIWHLVETMAVSRLFGAPRKLYDAIDRKIEEMDRTVLIRLALKSFLSADLDLYLRALADGSVTSRDAVLFYLRTQAAYDWISDCATAADHSWGEVFQLLDRLRDFVETHRQALLQMSKRCPEVRSLWRTIIQRADSRFITPDYTALLV